MELKKLQKLVDEFINEIGGYWGDSVILARLIEELGEIAHVIQHLKGFRPPLEDATIDLDAELELEMGDLFFVLISLANKRNISLEEALRVAKQESTTASAW